MEDKEIKIEYPLKNVEDVSIIAAAFDAYWSPTDRGGMFRVLQFADGRAAWVLLPNEESKHIRILAQQEPSIAYFNTHFSIQREIDDHARIKYCLTEIRNEIPCTREYKRAVIEFRQLPKQCIKISYHVWMPITEGWGATTPLLPNDILAAIFFDEFIRYYLGDEKQQFTTLAACGREISR